MGNSELCITSATKIVPYLKHCFGSYRYVTTSAKSMNAFAMNNKLTLETYECCISTVSRAIKTYGNTSPSPPPPENSQNPLLQAPIRTFEANIKGSFTACRKGR